MTLEIEPRVVLKTHAVLNPWRGFCANYMKTTKYIAGLLVGASILGLGAFINVPRASAEEITLQQLVELFIAIGVITPDKANAARTAVGLPVVDEVVVQSTSTNATANAIIYPTMQYPTIGEVFTAGDGEKQAYVTLGDATRALIVYNDAENFNRNRVDVKLSDLVNGKVTIGFGHTGIYNYTITAYTGEKVINTEQGTINVQ